MKVELDCGREKRLRDRRHRSQIKEVRKPPRPSISRLTLENQKGGKAMKSIRSYCLLVCILVMLLVGCSRSQNYGKAQPLVEMAIEDLNDRLDISEEEITVVKVEATEFSDTSLGVPKPGESYAQVVTPGYIIVLEVNGDNYVYHGADDRIVLVPES